GGGFGTGRAGTGGIVAFAGCASGGAGISTVGGTGGASSTFGASAGAAPRAPERRAGTALAAGINTVFSGTDGAGIRTVGPAAGSAAGAARRGGGKGGAGGSGGGGAGAFTGTV